MKYLLFLPLLFLSACADTPQQPASGPDQETTALQAERVNREICWSGTLDGRIPVFIHYGILDSLASGEMIYMNTKGRVPIRLMGYTDYGSGGYRLLEFSPWGAITGIITGSVEGSSFRGEWYPASETGRALPVRLTIKDTTVRTLAQPATRTDIYGQYHYDYGEDGIAGDLTIEKVDDTRIAFSIFSVTAETYGRNIAEVPKDTVTLSGNSFTYYIPDSDSCGINVSFYRDMACVKYTRGYCDGLFGLHASIDGIFMKVP